MAEFRAGMLEAMTELQQTTDALREQSATFLAEVERGGGIGARGQGPGVCAREGRAAQRAVGVVAL